MRDDLRFALRSLMRHRVFSIAAIATLAIGIGANTAVFTIVNAVLFEPVPYPQRERIVVLMNTWSGRPAASAISMRKFLAWRDSSSAIQIATLYAFGHAIDETDRSNMTTVAVGRITSGFFHVFGMRVLLGGAFGPGDDREGGPLVAIVSHSMWKDRLGGSPAAIGRKLVLNQNVYTIIGIAEPGLSIEGLAPGAIDPPDVWLPLHVQQNTTSNLHSYFAAGLLGTAGSIEAGRRQAARAAVDLRTVHPDAMPPEAGLYIEPIQTAFVRDVQPLLLLLWCAVALVLLIACANVVNLLLVRGSVRQRELAIRMATGASRFRIIRQLLTEGMVLAVAGGVAGLFVGLVSVRVLGAFQAWSLPRMSGRIATATLDPAVLAFTGAVAVLAGIGSGLWPAWIASRLELDDVLKPTSRSTGGGPAGRRLRGAVVASEVALAMTLLVGTVTLIATFVGLRRVHPGFDPQNVLTMQTSMVGERLATTAGWVSAVRTGVGDLERLPQVESAALTVTGLPLESRSALNISIVGRPRADEDYALGWFVVSSDYFKVLRVPVLRGRSFTDDDTESSMPVVLINAAMAARYWPNDEPLSSELVIAPRMGGELEESTPRRIVGVVGDVRNVSIRQEPRPAVYVPVTQMTARQVRFMNGLGVPLTWLIRTRGEPHAFADAARKVIGPAVGGLPVGRVRSLDEVSTGASAQAEFQMVVMTAFGAVALLLAATGLYGVIAYSVQQRRREIGIKLALGADAGGVRRSILFDGMKLAGMGIVVGYGLVEILRRLLAHLLTGLDGGGPLVLIIPPAVLILVAAAASWFPARAASLVEASEAIRTE